MTGTLPIYLRGTGDELAGSVANKLREENLTRIQKGPHHDKRTYCLTSVRPLY